MNFGEMKDWVARTVVRPEKRDEQIADAVNAAIKLMTAFGDFSNDLVEGTVAISSSVYAQSIVISDTFPRYRKLKYLRPDGYRKFLTWVDPSRIFDKAGCEQKDTWYRAGSNIVFKLSTLRSNMLYGYYQYPERLVEDEDEHWMLEQMETVVHDLSASRVFSNIGNDSESTRFQNLGMGQLNIFKNDLQDGVSHS